MSRFKARSGWGRALPSSCSYPGGESVGYFASSWLLGLAHPRLLWCRQPCFFLKRIGAVFILTPGLGLAPWTS
jgi:hypothetical protein